MKFVYVLEDEARFQTEIVESILQIDPKIQVRVFSRLESFVDWLRLAMTEGSKAIPLGGISIPGIIQEAVVEEEHQLVLVVSKIEILGVKQLSLLRKTRSLFIERKICTAEDPTAIVLTAFDDPQFKIKELEDRILNNIIFKPFDRLILLQHLTFAIDGRHPPSKYTIQNQKTTAVIEMLKEAPMEAISESAFVTRSERPVEAGKVAKYYGPHFQTERHRSLIGVCKSSSPHPTLKDQYSVVMRFFAADPIQISNIRKQARNPNAKKFNLQAPSGEEISRADIIMLDPDETTSSGLIGSLERRFAGVHTTYYSDFAEFYYELDPSQKAAAKDLPKAFEGAAEANLEWDPASNVLISANQGNGSPLIKLFGFTVADWKDKSNWLFKLIDNDHQEKWRRLIRDKGLEPADDPFFTIRAGEKSFTVKFVFRDKKENGHLLIKFVEATKEELVAQLQKNSKLPAKPIAIFISHKFLGENSTERWTLVLEMFKKRGAEPKLFLLSTEDYTDAQERTMATYLADIFFKPIDRSYLVTKFYQFFPGLKIIGEPITSDFMVAESKVKVANPVVIKEFSEAGFIMEYYRTISLGSFREVVLWQPYEIGAPELIATCNFHEEVQGKKDVYHNHFVLFGMHDLFLKSIRVWIRNNYILSKEAT